MKLASDGADGGWRCDGGADVSEGESRRIEEWQLSENLRVSHKTQPPMAELDDEGIGGE